MQLLVLTDIRTEGNDLRPVRFLEPSEQHRGIQTSGVGENDLHESSRAQIPLGIKPLPVGTCEPSL